MYAKEIADAESFSPSTEVHSESVLGSDLLLRSIVAEGVQVIFGYPGGAVMPAYDALTREERLHHVLVRHEQAASHAAEGYARITGRAGVCMVTSGPGATNLVTGIADAMMDSVPLVCITGQVPSSLLGTDAFQETDVIGVTLPITKWSYQITKASEIQTAVAKAFHIAQEGRPGPVLLDITKDALTGKACPSRGVVHPLKRAYPPKKDSISAAATLLNNALRPLVIVGHGVLIAKAEDELLTFAEKSGFPIASTLMGLSAFPTSHPQYVGLVGMHGNYAPNILTNQADVILAVGMRFDDRVTGRVSDYAKNAKVIHIDIDPSEIGKLVKAEVGIVADAKSALAALIPHLETRSFSSWFDRFDEAYREEHRRIITNDIFPKSPTISMAEVIAQVSEATKGEAIVVTDVGQHQMFAARYYKFKKANSFICSGGLGTMGFCLPAALGAALGEPERPIVAVVGDGGFQMTLQELGTIRQERLPIKMILLNNSYLGMVRQQQDMFFGGRHSHVDLENPDFIKLAEAFKIDGYEVTTRDELRAGIEKMLLTEGPFLLEVKVGRQDDVFPMITAGSSVDEIRLG